MTSLGIWWAVAGAGALHGANPITGGMLAAAWGTRWGDRRQALRALAPMATGHAMSLAVVATAVALGHSMAQWARPVIGIAALLFVAFLWRGQLCRAKLGTTPGAPTVHGRIGMALWSFVVCTLHGSGLMLVPALVPLCVAASPARGIAASGSLSVALAAVGVHALAMLGTQALVAAATVFGFVQVRRWCFRRKPNGHDGL
jgi:hypothetical protein